MRQLFILLIDICTFQKETEILFFLMIVIMIRTRKTGSVTMINYLTSSFVYTKIANLILWFYADVRMGSLFAFIFIRKDRWHSSIPIPKKWLRDEPYNVYFMCSVRTDIARTNISGSRERDLPARGQRAAGRVTAWQPSDLAGGVLYRVESSLCDLRAGILRALCGVRTL